MWKIGENEIKYLLKNREELQVHNYRRLFALYEEAEKADCMESLISAKTTRFGQKTGGGSGRKWDLGDTLEQIQSMQRKRVLEVRQGLCDVNREVEKINRVQICYEALKKFDIMGYNIVTKLYVEGEKYTSATREMKISHSAFEENRKRALKSIRTLYESEKGNNDLIMTTGMEEKGQKQVSKKEEVFSGSQMTLELLEIPYERTFTKKVK